MNMDFDWMVETNPSEAEIWLYHNFEDLKPVINGDRTLYKDSENKTIFYFYQNEKNRYCYFRYYGFWKVFEDEYGMKFTEIQELLKNGIHTKMDIYSPGSGSWKLPII